MHLSLTSFTNLVPAQRRFLSTVASALAGSVEVPAAVMVTETTTPAQPRLRHKLAPKIKTTTPSNLANVLPAHILNGVTQQTHNVYDAVELVKSHTWSKFVETVEIAVNLGVDPRKPNQSIKSVALLPHGTGKVVRIAVFAQGEDARVALDAGASVVGGEDLMFRIQSGDIPFDRIIATPEMMPIVGKIGKILGPRGLMPNPKMGTVTKDVQGAVKAAKAGTVQFRVEKRGIIQAGIGKANFTSQQLLDNIRAFMVAIGDAKPEAYKGKYVMKVHLSSTMGPGFSVDVSSVDPSNLKFMVHPSLLSSGAN